MKEYICRDVLDRQGNVVGREYQGELIRCKECQHLKVSGELEHTNGDTTFYYICDYWHRATDEWRYCDQGTRKDLPPVNPEMVAILKERIEEQRSQIEAEPKDGEE